MAKFRPIWSLWSGGRFDASILLLLVRSSTTAPRGHTTLDKLDRFLFQFHKSCIDQWLLEKRTCPMCKMDILKFYGLVEEAAPEEEAVLNLVSILKNFFPSSLMTRQNKLECL
jgi:hypothetical protein